MQVKTFTGPSTQDVLAQVKAELGPDAVILGSREFRKNGERLFEITAGVERMEHGPGAMSGGASGTPPGWDEWHKEWSRLKGHIYSLMGPAIQWERLNPRQRAALEYLQREGVEDDVVVELYEALLKADGSSMLSALTRLVPARPFSAELWPQRLHIMTGPFGAGKTSVALRLAMRLRADKPDLSIAFLNADCARGNGRLVLRHWCELSDFGYYETPDPTAMTAALRACRDAGAIFVDLPGLSLGETLEAKLAAAGLGNMGGNNLAAVHLTVSPQYDSRQLASVFRRHQTHLPQSIVWTKLDEAVGFGALVNAAVRHKIPVSALSYGPELQHSLAPAEESLIWRLLLKRQLPGRSPADAGPRV